MDFDYGWMLNPSFSLRFCAWENENFGVVYNKTNGKTHLISVFGISILSCLNHLDFVAESSISKMLSEEVGEQSILFPEALISETLTALKQLELVIVS